MIKPVILCVDDETIVLESLNAQIKQFFGSKFRIEIAENGKEALRIVKDLVKKEIDLPVVVSDHIMPGMKGDELLSDIFKLSNKTLNIMLTGQADSQAVGNAVNNAKLFRYMSKPWNSNDMNITIKEAVRSFFLDKEIEEQKVKLEELVVQLEEYNDTLDEIVDDRTKEIERQKDELETTLTRLKETQSQLIQSEKMASIGVLSNGVAHEINNPLNQINGGKELIRRYVREKASGHSNVLLPLLELIENGVIKASNIVRILNQFCDTSMAKSERIDINAIIDNCLFILQMQIDENTKIKKEYTGESYNLIGNEGNLHQVMLNILTNALQAIENSGSIFIKTDIENNYLKIRIKDNGIGIPEDNLKNVTDPFYTTKDPGKGTGLGLSIALKLINDHNGFISFDSQLKKGTTVDILFPIIT